MLRVQVGKCQIDIGPLDGRLEISRPEKQTLLQKRSFGPERAAT